MSEAGGMRRGRVRCLSPGGFHRMAYVEWGAPAAPRPVVCVHGLTRNGRDFDRLAARLAGAGHRAVCPDVVGRGESDWLAEASGYGYPQYLADMTVLLARLDVEAVDWVGTSMGGLIGMMLAAQPGTPIRRLVVNDVGPFIPKAALERIAGYVGADPRFADLAEAEAYLRRVHAPFGALAEAEWRRLAETSVEAHEGGIRLRYDPKIGEALRQGALEDVDLWDVWDRIACPALVLRGADSDLLSAETAAEMTRRGPRTRLVEIPGCGHAPALLDDSQITLVADWLARESAMVAPGGGTGDQPER